MCSEYLIQCFAPHTWSFSFSLMALAFQCGRLFLFLHSIVANRLNLKTKYFYLYCTFILIMEFLKIVFAIVIIEAKFIIFKNYLWKWISKSSTVIHSMIVPVEKCFKLNFFLSNHTWKIHCTAMPSVVSCCNYPSVSYFCFVSIVLHLVFCIIKSIKITTLSFNI